MSELDESNSAQGQKEGKSRLPCPVYVLIKSQLREAKVLDRLGVRYEFGTVGQLGVNPHAVTAAVRAFLEWIVSNKLRKQVNRLRSLWPRENELEMFRKGFQHVVGFRPVLYPTDYAAGRSLYAYDPWIEGEAFYMRDVYYYDSESLFMYTRMYEHPDCRGSGVRGYLALKDYRGTFGFDQIELPPLPPHLSKVKVKIPLRDGSGDIMLQPALAKGEKPKAWNKPGTPIMVAEEREDLVEAQDGFTYTEGAWRRPDYLTDPNATVTAYTISYGRAETTYSHPVFTDGFFDHSEEVFTVDPDDYEDEGLVFWERFYVMRTCHVQTVLFGNYLLAVSFRIVPSYQPPSPGLPLSAFCVSGVSAVAAELMAETLAVDPSSKSSLTAFAHKVSRRLMNRLKGNPIIQLKGWSEAIHDACKTTTDRKSVV